MSILTRAILTGVLLGVPFVSTAYPAALDKSGPIAQVYDIQGQASVKNSSGGNAGRVEKGILLGPDDILTLEKNASVSMYFKSGGRKELKAQDNPSEYRVADLKPKTAMYSQSIPYFGATRGIPSAPPAFFYPQEAVILDAVPVVEFTLFSGSGEIIPLGTATVQTTKDKAVLDSQSFDNLEYGAPYSYQPPRLASQTEYSVELKLELKKGIGIVAMAFPLYIAGIPDNATSSKHVLFSDPVYRSWESTWIDYKGQKCLITAFKQLVMRDERAKPVIVIEFFIP